MFLKQFHNHYGGSNMGEQHQDFKAESKIAIFKDKKIRRTIHNNEWWFSIIDIIEVLTNSSRPRKYWADLKKQLIKDWCAPSSNVKIFTNTDYGK